MAEMIITHVGDTKVDPIIIPLSNKAVSGLDTDAALSDELTAEDLKINLNDFIAEFPFACRARRILHTAAVGKRRAFAHRY